MVRLLPALALTLALPAAAQDAAPLPTGKTIRASLPTAGHIWQSYRIRVPEGATGLDLRLSGSGNADLYVRAGAPMENRWQRTATASSTGDTSDEHLLITPAEGLCACVYYVDVVHGEGASGRPLKYALRANVQRGAGPGATAGGPQDTSTSSAKASFGADFETEVDLSDPELNYVTYRLEVSDDVQSVDLALTGAHRDMNLYARFGGTMPNWMSAHHRATSDRADETLTLSRDGAPRLHTGVYYVDVGRAESQGDTATLTGRFTHGYDGPPVVGPLPDPSTEPDVSGEISEDMAFRINLDEGKKYRTYVLHVPPGGRSLLVRATGALGDTDLYLRHEEPMADYSVDPDHSANGTRADEQLYVTGQSDPPLRPGRYFLDVVRPGDSEDVGPLDLQVVFDGPEPPPMPAISGPLIALRSGVRASADLAESGHRGARYRFEVPRNARSMDVQILGATRDVDLFLRNGEIITDHSDAEGYDLKSVTGRLNEHIRLDATTDPPLSAGTWYLDVASLVASDKDIRFDVALTIDGPRPTEAISMPPYFRGAHLTPLQNVLQSVVQVSCRDGRGSGTVIGEDGWIITNHHVIEEDGGQQTEGILISVTDDFDEPPQQRFIAEAVAWDEDLDLALLHITQDIFDRPVSGLHLPALALGEVDGLNHGDTIYIAGFPAVGGFESRASVSLTQGIVSGVITDAHGERVWVKTDARINAGNSGGTALDGDLNYIGVPSRERVDADDELGYARPTAQIPQEWINRTR